MKIFSFTILCVFSLTAAVVGQTKPTLTANNHSTVPPTSSVANATRARITQTASQTPQWGNASATTTNDPKLDKPATVISNSTSPATTNVTTALTQTYRVGIGDILDIQIPDSLSTKSTLYTIGKNGMLDYPLATGPIQADGLTTDAIAARLKSSIRVLDVSSINVKVRDYASHNVNVIGFVSSPGVKVLRREAVPLYVVLAEATPLSDATSVTVVRNGRTVAIVGLRDQSAAGQLVVSGDVIKISDRTVGTK